jgi:hypothetical protein
MLLLLSGHARDSLRMNALAGPVLLATTALAATALARDASSPRGRARLSAAMTATAVAYGAAVALWVLRWFGLFGGPVPV